MSALESCGTAIKMQRNMENSRRNVDILFAQEFDGGFMDYFISIQPSLSWILPAYIRSVYKVVPFNLNPYWFSHCMYLFLWRGSFLFFFFPFFLFFLTYLAGLQLESKQDCSEQILLLCSSAGEVPLWDPLSGLLTKVFFFFLFCFVFNVFSSNA